MAALRIDLLHFNDNVILTVNSDKFKFAAISLLIRPMATKGH